MNYNFEAQRLSGSAVFDSQVNGATEGTWTIVPGGEGATMFFASLTDLRYGIEGLWAYKTLSGTVTFNNTTFGDPAPGSAKNGYYYTAATATISLTGAASTQVNSSTTGAVSNSASTVKTLTVAASSQSSTSGVGAISKGAVAPTVITLTGAASTVTNTSSTGQIIKNIVYVSDPVPPQTFLQWLRDGTARRCVLMDVNVQVDGVETTRYLSNKAYVTASNETPANTAYNTSIVGGVQFTEKISLEGAVSLSYGDIELTNHGSGKDSWLDDIWTNRSVKIYIGDVSWPKSQFQLVFNGVVTGVDANGRDRINIKLSDKLQRLNTPVTENKLGGTSQNKDRLIPLCFGEVFNIEPLLVDPANHEYQVHDGQIERIIEVRDNGVPVSFTEFPLTGKFRLNQSSVGQITCSVQGDKSGGWYYTKIADIVTRLVTGFGTASQRLTTADLDTALLDAFNAVQTAPVGLYLSDRANVLECVNRLAQSVGAAAIMSSTGRLSLVQLTVPRSDSGTAVTATNMKERSLVVSEMPDVVASVKIGFAQNYTVQTNIQTGIPAAHVAMFAQDWLTATSADAATATKYQLFSDPVMIETQLLTEAAAQAEAQRRLNMYKVQRKVLRYSGMPELLIEQLGATQTITHSRFGLSSGKAGQIISKQSDWLSTAIELEILI
jgi:hypothetical protein